MTPLRAPSSLRFFNNRASFLPITSCAIIFFLVSLLVFEAEAFMVQRTKQLPLCMPLHAGFGKASSVAKENTPPKRALLRDEDKCPCGSGSTYSSCCKQFHASKEPNPTPEQLIRARYSAYALEDPEYIIETTAPTSPDYLAYFETAVAPKNGRSRWIRDLKTNMMLQYKFVKCEIDGVEYSTRANNNKDAASIEVALVKYRHLAIKMEDNVCYPVAEESTLVDIDGRWKFETGAVKRPEAEISQEMMNKWPAEAGLALRDKDGKISYQIA